MFNMNDCYEKCVNETDYYTYCSDVTKQELGLRKYISDRRKQTCQYEEKNKERVADLPTL